MAKLPSKKFISKISTGETCLSLGEVENFVKDSYNQTFGRSTIRSMAKYIVDFFADLPAVDRALGDSFLMQMIVQAEEKLGKFGKDLLKVASSRNLGKGEFATFKTKHEVGEILKFDILVLCLEYLSSPPARLKDKYNVFITFIEKSSDYQLFLEAIHGVKIENSAIGWQGGKVNTSAPVYNMMNMRISRGFNSVIFRHTELISISRSSPYSYEFIQNVDFDLLFNILKELNVWVFIQCWVGVKGIKFLNETMGVIRDEWVKYYFKKKWLKEEQATLSGADGDVMSQAKAKLREEDKKITNEFIKFANVDSLADLSEGVISIPQFLRDVMDRQSKEIGQLKKKKLTGKDKVKLTEKERSLKKMKTYSVKVDEVGE